MMEELGQTLGNPLQITVQKKTNRKRKRPKAVSRMEKSLSFIMDKFIVCQHEVEDRYMQLEEKRLKLMKELEDHRQEVEERRQEADRQHELQMWIMMMQAMGGSGSGGPPGYRAPYQFYQPTPRSPSCPPGACD